VTKAISEKFSSFKNQHEYSAFLTSVFLVVLRRQITPANSAQATKDMMFNVGNFWPEVSECYDSCLSIFTPDTRAVTDQASNKIEKLLLDFITGLIGDCTRIWCKDAQTTVVTLRNFGPEITNKTPNEVLDFGLYWEEFVKASKGIDVTREEYKKAVNRLSQRTPKDLSLLILDEATELLKVETPKKEDVNLNEETTATNLKFLQFRRALIDFPQKIVPFVAVLLDTNSGLTNFVPEAKFDRSIRVSSRDTILFPPFYYFPREVPILHTGDIFRLPFHVNCGGGGEVYYNPVMLAVQSRPLFSAVLYQKLLETMTSDTMINEVMGLVNTAKQKLIHHKEESVSKIVPPETLSLACFALAACRFYLSSTVHTTKELLVKQHMGTIVSCSNERDVLFVEYPSEPILAEAAAQHMRDNETFQLVLETLIERIGKNTLLSSGGKGEVGELVASLLLSRLFDISSWARNNSPSKLISVPTSLVSLLRNLFISAESLAIINEIKINFRDFISGVVYFSHFVKVNFQPQQKDLIHYVQRCLAITCSFDETGTDLIIPVAIPKSASMDIFNPATYTLTAIVVQAKNYGLKTSGSTVPTMTEKIYSTPFFKSCEISPIMLMMNVGPGSIGTKRSLLPFLRVTATEEQCVAKTEDEKLEVEKSEEKTKFLTTVKFTYHKFGEVHEIKTAQQIDPKGNAGAAEEKEKRKRKKKKKKKRKL
jgi:hypothetical protein